MLNALYALADRATEPDANDTPVARGPIVRAALLFLAVDLQEQLALTGEAVVFDAIPPDAGDRDHPLRIDCGRRECGVRDREEAVNLLGLAAARRASVSVNDPAAGRTFSSFGP